MDFVGMLIGVILGLLAFDAAKERREIDRDISDTVKDRNDSYSQRKNSGSRGGLSQSGDTKMSGSSITLNGQKAVLSPENTTKRAGKSGLPPVSDNAVRPVPAKPDMDVPDYFTPYEGADMTCAEADAAGFEFVGADRYHGVDFWLSVQISKRRDSNEEIFYVHKGQYNGAGIPGCAVTGWHGSDEIVKVPRSINGRPVVKIETRAFFGNEKIREIYLPDSVIDIGRSAFFCCHSLTYARLSKSLAHIGKDAFFHCTALERVYLGGVRVVDEYVFSNCRQLTSVKLPETVELLGGFAFSATGLKKLYWNEIIHAEDRVLEGTPYIKNNSVVLLGDCLQKCCLKNVGEIIIDNSKIKSIAARCFDESVARKVILSDNVRELKGACFCTRRDGRIDEIYAPGLWKFGNDCFSHGQKITVSGEAEYVTENMAATGYLYIDERSFRHTQMEKLYPGGNSDNPCVCVMVRNILARVELRQSFAGSDVSREILTISEDGSTLIMDDRVQYTAARHIPNLGTKKLIVSRNMHTLRSFGSIEDFEEIVFRKPVVSAREKVPSFRPKKSVIIRFKFKFDFPAYGKSIDSAVLLYLPNVVKDSPEAEKLYALYDRCLGAGFNFNLYDSEILTLVSSYRARFTIARLRLEGDFELSPEARERYENFLLAHKRKAEFTAKKHGDTALLSLLEKLSPKTTDPKGDTQK
ncbi:MAG: leucine-rich repeat domain-containing protein [Oscillospiraceae bacterium]|nr:leucine-rich repeat domain-containing protein [Oscillospiraceae bacterium]